MSYRRRHWWFRRMALGLAFSVAAFAGSASVAAAKVDEGAGQSVISDPYLTDVFVRPGESLGGPDGAAIAAAATRPDDLANRFVHADASPRPEPASSGGGSTVEWNEALTVGIGAVVLALGLGLALGYVRRPRIAGL